MTIRTQTLLMVTLLLVAAVLATAGVVGWSSRQALLAETETQGLVIARLLARSAAFGAHVMSDFQSPVRVVPGGPSRRFPAPNGQRFGQRRKAVYWHSAAIG